MSFFIYYIDDKDKSMDFYKILLSRIEELPVGTIFTIGQAYLGHGVVTACSNKAVKMYA